MAVAKRGQDRPNVVLRQAARPARPVAPATVLGHKLFIEPIQLLDLDEIVRCWGKTRYQVYQLVNRERLHTVGRLGHQRYYLRDEVEKEFGPAEIDPDPDGLIRRLYRSGFESGTRAA